MQLSEQGRSLDSSVLVLNRSYLAVHVVNVRRAFALLYRQYAEVIDMEDNQFANYDFAGWLVVSEMRWGAWSHRHESPWDWIRAISGSIQVPRVIRLVDFDRQPRQSLRLNRRNLFARDDHRCQYCSANLPPQQLSIDHVLPRSRGGKTTWENVVCACVRCNTKKGGRTPKEARMQLIRPPRKPQHNPLLTLKMQNPKYASWRSFLPHQAARSSPL